MIGESLLAKEERVSQSSLGERMYLLDSEGGNVTPPNGDNLDFST